MCTYRKGARVFLKEEALRLPYMSDCNNLSKGMKGTIVGMTSSEDKYAIEFDEPIFTGMYKNTSYYNSGCHGKGKMDHCAYIPIDMVFGFKHDIDEPFVVGFIDLDANSDFDNALIALL